MKSLRNKRIKSHTNQLQFSTDQNELYQMKDEKAQPFKPFEGKFSRIKQPWMHLQSNNSSVLQTDKQIQKEQRRVFTQAQTNDHYESDFQQYESSAKLNQTVQQQNQIPFDTIYNQNISSFMQTATDFYFHTEKDLNRMNCKLIEQIQFFRVGLQRHRHNSYVLQKQKKQLGKLNVLKEKSFDYFYELKLEREVNNKTDLSKSEVSRIRQASVMLKKQKYKTNKESYRKANPNSELPHPNPQSNPNSKQFSIVREQLLCKKRQFYEHKEYIQQLDSKIKHYEQILDQYESRISLGYPQKLQQRKRQLQIDITMKKAAKDQAQISVNLQISNFNNQLSIVEIEAIKTQQKRDAIRQKLRQYELITHFSPKNNPKIINLFRKRSIFQANSPQSLLKIPQSPQTPKAISRFYYNRQKNRNSNVYLQDL